MERSDADFRLAVDEAMAGIVAGEPTATWRLYELAAPAVRGLVRREADRVGAYLPADDLDGLTLDAVVELARLAEAWRPDGALPWIWARRRIEALVHSFLGMFTRELDDDLDVEEPTPASVPVEPLEALRRLARKDSRARALRDRLEAAVSERDAAIWLAVQAERGGGNRAPAVTVGAYHGMRPAAVRKVVQRVGLRIAAPSSPAALAA